MTTWSDAHLEQLTRLWHEHSPNETTHEFDERVSRIFKRSVNATKAKRLALPGLSFEPRVKRNWPMPDNFIEMAMVNSYDKMEVMFKTSSVCISRWMMTMTPEQLAQRRQTMISYRTSGNASKTRVTDNKRRKFRDVDVILWPEHKWEKRARVANARFVAKFSEVAARCGWIILGGKV